MEIHSIHDVAKLLRTAEVAEQFCIETSNVLEACKSGRLTEDEAVLTSVGWLITPDGAARLWPRRPTIESTLRDALVGKTWPMAQLVDAAKADILPLIGTERKRHLVLTIANARKLLVEFKDKTVVFYSDAADNTTFHVAHVAPIEPTSIYVCPRGIDGEVYRETYDTPYEAEQRIHSFDDAPGWAKIVTKSEQIPTIGKRV